MHLTAQEDYMRTLALLALAAFAAAQPNQEKITKEIRHELVMLPYYGVFDNLAYAWMGPRSRYSAR